MKEFKDTYRPLPNGLTIMESKIEGLGLYNQEDFSIGEVFGETHVFGQSFNYKKRMGTNSTWWIYKP